MIYIHYAFYTSILLRYIHVLTYVVSLNVIGTAGGGGGAGEVVHLHTLPTGKMDAGT